jgi:hypothetical protein
VSLRRGRVQGRGGLSSLNVGAATVLGQGKNSFDDEEGTGAVSDSGMGCDTESEEIFPTSSSHDSCNMEKQTRT